MTISINVDTQYLEHQSQPDSNKFTFAYTITICNTGHDYVQLMRRHWYITDGNNKIQEVQGKGVIGETPLIAPGKSFCYTSGAVLPTSVGTMHGSYQFLDATQRDFEVPIPVFRLAIEACVH